MAMKTHSIEPIHRQMSIESRQKTQPINRNAVVETFTCSGALMFGRGCTSGDCEFVSTKLANINHVRLLRQGDGLGIGNNYACRLRSIRIVGHLGHLTHTHTHTHPAHIHFATEMDASICHGARNKKSNQRNKACSVCRVNAQKLPSNANSG